MGVGSRGSGEKGLLLLLLLLSHKYFASSSEDVQALYAVPTCLENSVEMAGGTCMQAKFDLIVW